MAAALAYGYHDAAAQVGVSVDVIRRAVRAGDLIPRYPTSKPVIRAVDLQAWIDRAPTEKPEKG